ncbi:MAG: hypothetical protein CFE45_20000, partial [Burkholderiales bacterium PBB5]
MNAAFCAGVLVPAVTLIDSITVGCCTAWPPMNHCVAGTQSIITAVTSARLASVWWVMSVSAAARA